MSPYLSEDKKEFFACGNPIVISEDPEGLLIKWADGEMKVSSDIDIFGGTDTVSEGKEVVDFKSTSITLNSGTIKNSVWGSNKGPGTIDKVTMIMNGGKVENGFSAGCSYGAQIVPTWKSPEKGITHIKESHVTMNDGEVYLLYGGTGSGTSLVDKAYFIMNGGIADYATAGNSNGTIKAIDGKFNGGTVTSQASASMRGTAGDITLKVTGGEYAYMAVAGDIQSKVTGKVTAGIFGGTVEKFCLVDTVENKDATIKMTVKAAPGLLKEEDIKGTDIVEDSTLGEGAEMKTVRLYPFPHKCKKIYGILAKGEAIDMPAELPMSQQEIAFVLGTAHAYEVIGDKLVVLSEHNYKLDNTDAPAFTGTLPCEDCEISYPRAKEGDVVNDATDSEEKEPTVEDPKTEQPAPQAEDNINTEETVE